MKYEPLEALRDKISKNGGLVNSHSHLDRAYTVNKINLLTHTHKHLYEKWMLVDEYKKQASIEDYFENISHALKKQLSFGTSNILSFIDIDEVSEYRAISAAKKAIAFGEVIGINLLIACQTLKGICSKKSRSFI